MVLSNVDRQLLQRCLDRTERAWEEFVDRYLGLVVHVVQHTAQGRSIALPFELREDLTAEVFVSLVRDDFAVLRRFRGESSLATYLAVIARRVVVRKMLQLKLQTESGMVTSVEYVDPQSKDPLDWMNNQERVQMAMRQLGENEATAIRMFHLEGKTYQEISDCMGMPENSVGPMLSRARDKMKRTLEAR